MRNAVREHLDPQIVSSIGALLDPGFPYHADSRSAAKPSKLVKGAVQPSMWFADRPRKQTEAKVGRAKTSARI
jgi:hypothetical protein